MDTQPSMRPLLVACSVFRAELGHLAETLWPGIEIRYRPWQLHSRPRQLGAAINAVVEEELEQGRPVLLVFGDCFTGCAACTGRYQATRIQGANCAEILLGGPHYRQLSHEGAMFVLPAWARHGVAFFRQQLGLPPEICASMMRDLHTKLVYLDTGLGPLPTLGLNDLAEYCGLPVEVLPVALDRLCTAVATALERQAAGDQPP